MGLEGASSRSSDHVQPFEKVASSQVSSSGSVRSVGSKFGQSSGGSWPSSWESLMDQNWSGVYFEVWGLAKVPAKLMQDSHDE
jgi:hypothetical protein